MISSPLFSTCGMKMPMKVPSIEPRPPNRLAPPSTTPVITVRLSVACPVRVVPLLNPSERMPAAPDSAPAST
jgi:hypothetical protein